MICLQAMNTGHDGSLSTGHANSCRDMMSRLETMVLMGMELPLTAIRSQIASGLDILVHLGRMRDKSRKGPDNYRSDWYAGREIVLKDLYRYVEKPSDGETVCGELQRVGTLLIRKNVKEQESHFLVQENKWIIVNIGVICGNDWGV